MDKLENLLVRMEAVVTRMELQAKGELVAENSARVVTELTELFDGFEKVFIPLSIQIGPAVGSAADTVLKAMRAGLQLVKEVYNRLPLLETQVAEFYQPLTAVCKYAQTPIDYQKSFCKALEMVPDIFFFITDNTPISQAKSVVESVKFYTNDVLRAKGHEKSTEWVVMLLDMLQKLLKIIDEEYGDRKIRFSGSAYTQSLPVPQEAQQVGAFGEPERQAHDAKKKPVRVPRQEFVAGKNLHELEYLTGQTITLEVERQQSLNVFGCYKCVIIVKGKINMINLNQCTDVTLMAQSCISQVDIIRCEQIKLQITSFAPTFNIENCEAVKLYLHDNCQESYILTYHSSCVWIIQLIEKDGEFVSGDLEFEVPSHYYHSWGKKGIKTAPVEVCGE